MTTDTSERGLERLICTALTGSPCDPDGADAGAADAVHEQPAAYGAGWICGNPKDYDREYCVDLAQLAAFLRETQPDAAEALGLEEDGATRRKFLARLQGEVSKRGTIDVLRHGIKHGPHHLNLFYGTPAPGNVKAQELYGQNRFSVTRPLRYSRDETQLALDLALFINGLPVATFELKNSLTKQTVEDAVQQYRRDRDPREKLFEFGRCVVHFAVDEHEVRFCTHLKGKGSWFLPFNQGWNDGAGNPPNPDGLKTDYLWKRVLPPDGLTDILENYAQIVVTDRKILDQQIKDTIKQFAQVGATVGHAERSGDLRRFIAEGKKIIISTVQKFPFILEEIGSEHRGRTFAIIIDEAHSSQGGRTSAAVSMALGADGAEGEDETTEDTINRLMEAKKLVPNAGYFAFTATPKNKTLEIFGRPEPQPDGTVQHHPFHSYTMKQAIQEGFILDVLKHYTPLESYYKLVKKVESDPEFDTKRAKKKLRRYVESNDHAIRLKAEIMVDHFHEQVLALGKIGGQARAMVVTGGVERAIQYYHAISGYLAERKSPHRAIVAFSGERDYGGTQVTEASLNGFPSAKIAENIQEDPYRFLVCADKFQTGYDEPLLHTMYVDKVLSGIKAVQTLSRLNRAHPQKHDVFVLDFTNDADTIQEAFADYYRTTTLAEETDPDKLHDLKATLDAHQVYADVEIEELVTLYLEGADRERLDPILDGCVAVYKQQLDEDGQVDFKSKAKAFLRTYGFLASILPYTNAEWEKLSIFLNFLVPKLPAPVEEDLSKGILEAIDMDSYRVEKQAARQIQLPDTDAEIPPVPTTGGGRRPAPELDRLSNIIKAFNDQFGNIPWSDADRVHRLITEDIPNRVAEDKAYRNAKQNSDKENARIEHDKALARVMTALLKDDTDLFKYFVDDESFRRWLSDMVFAQTYEKSGA